MLGEADVQAFALALHPGAAAKEVRQLALISKEIISRGSTTVDTFVQALRNISKTIGSMASMLKEIGSASEVQAITVEEVGHQVDSVASATRMG